MKIDRRITALRCAIREDRISIDSRLLDVTEDLDAAAVLTWMLWAEQATRDDFDPGKFDPEEPWQPPRGLSSWSHWFTFSYADVIDALGRSITRVRVRSALRYLIARLGIIETRRGSEFPAQVEYRVDFDWLVQWMNTGRPEDLDVFQRSRPPKGDFILPELHPVSGKPHGYHKRQSKIPDVMKRRPRRKKNAPSV